MKEEKVLVGMLFLPSKTDGASAPCLARLVPRQSGSDRLIAALDAHLEPSLP